MNLITKITFTCLLFIGFIATFPQESFAQMEFVENKGQWHPNVKYQGEFNSGSFFLENKGFTVLLQKPQDIIKRAELMHGGFEPNNHSASGIASTNRLPNPGDTSGNNPQAGSSFVFHNFVYKVSFLGASNAVIQEPDKESSSYNNYFIGNDPAKWASNCKIYQAITYKNLYPNIDVRYYSSEGRLKYDFIVRPGGNVNAIAMRYDGPVKLALKNKELIVTTPLGDVKELYPYSYQAGSAKRTEVESKYIVRDNVVTFDVRNYDQSQTLVIDPSIIFSSFTGSTAANWGYTATPGADGSFFAGGIVFGAGYKVSPGAYDVTFNGGDNSREKIGGYDIAIFKFSANGSQRLYATYLGGSGNEQPHSMIADAQGNLTIAGRTNSPDSGGGAFPLKPLSNKVGPCGKYDIILTTLNSTGTALVGSVRIGGKNDDGVNIRPKYEGTLGAESIRRNYGDDARSEVILDNAKNIYLASCTRSTDFPVINSNIQQGLNGLQDGVVLKFSGNLSVPLFSTYFGGDLNDACFVLALNQSTGSLYVGGATESSKLPGNMTGVISDKLGGTIDGFVTEMRGDGSAVLKTTYIGTDKVDIVYGLKLDRNGYPYVMGTTTSSQWPIINSVYGNAGAKQFIGKLQPDLSAYVYSTAFGNGSTDPNISPIAFLVDRCENVYVSGWGGGVNISQKYSTGSTAGLPEVNPLANAPAADGQDFYFFVLQKNAASCLFASHFGQNGGFGDHVDGGTSRFDENGVIYQAMCANCGGGVNFPTTPSVWARQNGSVECNQAAVKISLNFAGVGANLKSTIDGLPDSSGCIPFTAVFRDTLLLAKKYIWDFGDGSPRVTTFKPTNTTSHTYLTPGSFRVMLIAEDSSTCNVRDTIYLTIRAANNPVNLSFTNVKLPPCESLTVQFTNTSTPNYPNFGPKTFVWDYGDGSPKDTAGFAPPRVHSYAKSGKYTVSLALYDTSFCNSPDSIQKDIRIDAFVKAIFTTDPLGCAPYTAFFTNDSQAGTDFIWQFDNGTVFSNDESPTYTFPLPGTFRVRLIAIDTNTCNKRDTSAYFTIKVLPKPKAFATWSPNPPIENVPVSFKNQSSQGAIKYEWNFGDGETSTLFEPVHEYNETGSYDAELVAFNQLGCTDTFRMLVSVIVLPLLDVPNAFTPGQFGDNGIVKVRGFGITKLSWRIYNRWGQMVFESNNKSSGWDGKVKGKLQPVDVYTYTLEAEFSDGKKARKTGDITLLR